MLIMRASSESGSAPLLASVAPKIPQALLLVKLAVFAEAVDNFTMLAILVAARTMVISSMVGR